MPAARIHALLDDRKIPYEVHSHSRAVTAQRLAATEGISGWEVAKPVLVSISGELAMLVVPAAVHVDLGLVSEHLGHNEVRLATEDEFVGVFSDCEAGAEPPFGNLYDVPVFLDERLRSQPRIVCRDGSHTETLTLAMQDYLAVVEPEIVNVSAQPA